MGIKNKIAFIIDDDFEIVNLLKKIFEAQGMVVVSAGNLKDAEEVLSKNIPHIIFLDIKLGKENGLTFLANVKNSPTGKDIPVIIFSGIENPQVTKKAMDLGAIDFLNKPINATQIMQKVKKHLASVKANTHLFLDYKNRPQLFTLNGKIKNFNQNQIEFETTVMLEDSAVVTLEAAFCEKIKFNGSKFINKGKITNLGKGKFLHKLFYVGITDNVVQNIIELK